MNDFAYPDLEMLAINMVAKHSMVVGPNSFEVFALHVTCHLKRLMEFVLILNKPTSVLQWLQKMCSTFPAKPSPTALLLAVAAWLAVDVEN